MRCSCRILTNLKFSRQTFEETQISSLIIIRPFGAELFHTDRRTNGRTDGHDEANSRFSKYCERAQNPLCDSARERERDCVFRRLLSIIIIVAGLCVLCEVRTLSE